MLTGHQSYVKYVKRVKMEWESKSKQEFLDKFKAEYEQHRARNNLTHDNTEWPDTYTVEYRYVVPKSLQETVKDQIVAFLTSEEQNWSMDCIEIKCNVPGSYNYNFEVYLTVPKYLLE